MICVSIFADQYAKCKEGLSKADYIEIRLDKSLLSDLELVEILSLKKKIIATCRRGNRPDKDRKKILFEMINRGVDFIDLDIDGDNEIMADLIKEIKRTSVKLIISYHNYKKTPPLNRMGKIIQQGFKLNADLVKIATMINSPKDILNIFSIYSNYQESFNSKIIALGMGKKGVITRIAAPLLGSPFTYVSGPGLRKTAEGQLDLDQMRSILNIC